MLQNNVTLEDLAEYSEKADKNKHPLNRVREHKSGKPTVPKRGEQIRGEVSEPKQTRRNAYKAPSRPETTNTTEET